MVRLIKTAVQVNANGFEHILALLWKVLCRAAPEFVPIAEEMIYRREVGRRPSLRRGQELCKLQ